MVDEFTRRLSSIFVDDGEGRAIDDILYAQSCAERFDEGGLARTHRGIEGKDISPREDLFDELPSDRL